MRRLGCSLVYKLGATFHLARSSSTTATGSGAGYGQPAPPVLSSSAVHERLHKLLTTDAAALRLHRELTVAFASGDADGAADCAAAIARRMQKFVQAQQSSSEKQVDEPGDVPPAPTSTTMEMLMEKAAEPLAPAASVMESDGPESPSAAAAAAPPFWRNPNALTLTILSTDFESENDDDELDIKILDEYLKKENESWKEQKRAVANRILAAARELGITPEVVHGSEAEQMKSETFRPLRHVNLVVRAEMARLEPEVEAEVRAAAEVIKQRLEEKQQATLDSNQLDKEDDTAHQRLFVGQVAFLELAAGKSKMKYSVGLHKDLEAALGTELARTFVGRIVASLNGVEGDGGSKSDDDALIRRVVLPYTSMIKLCLWYRADLQEGTQIR